MGMSPVQKGLLFGQKRARHASHFCYWLVEQLPWRKHTQCQIDVIVTSRKCKIIYDKRSILTLVTDLSVNTDISVIFTD